VTKEYTMITLGIDLSLTGTGCVVMKSGKMVSNKLIKSKPSGGRPIDELNRIIKIRDEIEISDAKIAVIEGLAFMARNTTSLIQLSALNYFVREKLSILNIPFVIVAPTSLKKFVTGKGNSPKDLMLLATYKKYGEYFTNDNLCDAYGLAKIGHVLTQKNPKLIKPQQEVINLLKKQYEKK